MTTVSTKKTPVEENESWIYTYTTEEKPRLCTCQAETDKGGTANGCPKEKTVAIGAGTLKVHPNYEFVELEICGETTQGQAIRFQLSPSAACMLIATLAMAVEQTSNNKPLAKENY